MSTPPGNAGDWPGGGGVLTSSSCHEFTPTTSSSSTTPSEIQPAHLVGASMGGFIVQVMAIRHPERALSLTSIMSAPGGLRDNVPATPEATAALLAPAPTDRQGMIEFSVAMGRVLSGPLYD